jgi:hypothetical protein
VAANEKPTACRVTGDHLLPRTPAVTPNWSVLHYSHRRYDDDRTHTDWSDRELLLQW